MRPALEPLPLRLSPGADLREALQAALAQRQAQAAFVIAGIGSLLHAQLRLADAAQATRIDGPLEILSLAGTLSPEGPHLHIAVADAQGRVTGGHVVAGCTVRTTAEVLLGLLPGWRFAREPDAATGYAELAITAPPATSI
jgi:predicted DNA-binding protein with PD1-like motif